jgi:phosphate butyryltransferase
MVMSPQAARIKGVKSRISGDPDILLVPDIACGNIFAKGIWHLAKAKIAGLIIGARKPIILLSRSDNAVTKLNSIALAVVTSRCS